MKKYIIFDFDGTLVESTEDIKNLVVVFITRNFWADFDQKVRYILSTTKWTPLVIQLKMILWQREDLEKIKEELYEIIIKESKEKFFPWVKEKIKELSTKYTLFLTTSNSTKAAKKALVNGWIIGCFSEIIWSDSLLKWPEHIKKFFDSLSDEEFYEKAIYIGDGDRDREIAMKYKIDFIHIGTDNIDTYEIASLKYIDPILDELNRKKSWKH